MQPSFSWHEQIYFQMERVWLYFSLDSIFFNFMYIYVCVCVCVYIYTYIYLKVLWCPSLGELHGE